MNTDLATTRSLGFGSRVLNLISNKPKLGFHAGVECCADEVELLADSKRI